MAVTDWPDLPVETSGDPHAMSQADQNRLERNPRWSPAYASASSASNSAFYFTHTTRKRPGSCSTTGYGRLRWRFGEPE